MKWYLEPIVSELQGRGVFLSKIIIQMECTQIRTSEVVQDSIKSMYDTIVVWLHTTINRTYNVNVPKNKSQKMPIQIFQILIE